MYAVYTKIKRFQVNNCLHFLKSLALRVYVTGGGILKLDIRKILQVEGSITANGKAGHTTNIAGGSGGAILINTMRLEGSGSIQVAGGNGGTDTGSGGGGRVAVYYKTTEHWFGTFNANGGSGSDGIGGAGTVYLKVCVVSSHLRITTNVWS